MSLKNRSSFCLKINVNRAECEINEKMDELVKSVERMRVNLLSELEFKEDEVTYDSFPEIQDLETLRRHRSQTEDLFRENRQQELLKDNMHIIDKKIAGIKDNLNTREIIIIWRLEEFDKALNNIATLTTSEEMPPPPPPPRKKQLNNSFSLPVREDTPPPEIAPPIPSRDRTVHRVVKIDELEGEDTQDSNDIYMRMASAANNDEAGKPTLPLPNNESTNTKRVYKKSHTIDATVGSRTPFDPLPEISGEEVPAIPPKSINNRRRSCQPTTKLQEEKILGIQIERVVPIFAGYNKGKEYDELNKASTVDIDIATSDIYIADTYNNCIKVFDSCGSFKFLFGRKSPGKVYNPYGLCICRKTVYVGEKMDGRIKAFTMDGTYIKEITGDGTKKGSYKFLWGITADSDNGDIYACDNERDRIQTYSSYLEFKYTVIGPDKAGSVTRPVDVKVRDQMIIVLDQGDPCVHYFDKQGVPLWSMVSFERAKVAMAPQCFTLDMKDNILITDANTHTIRIFTPKGELFIALGRKGENKGEFLFPSGIALDTSGNIVSVCQRDRANLQIISYQKASI